MILDDENILEDKNKDLIKNPFYIIHSLRDKISDKEYENDILNTLNQIPLLDTNVDHEWRLYSDCIMFRLIINSYRFFDINISKYNNTMYLESCTFYDDIYNENYFNIKMNDIDNYFKNLAELYDGNFEKIDNYSNTNEKYTIFVIEFNF